MRDFVDMHVHSTASDGSDSPSRLVELADSLGLYAFVLSDHDTVAGVDEALQAARGKGVKVIPGIELSSSYRGGDVHILGINIDHKNPDFVRELVVFQKSRELRNEKMMAKLAECGFPISEEAKKRIFKDSSVTRAHFARYLMEIGAARTITEAFDRYLRKGCPCYVPREMITPAKALEFIRLAGGQAVLAHPMLYRHLSREELEALILRMKDEGLVGIETFYSTNTPEEEAYTRHLAEKYGLLMTGGSDYHGTVKPDIALMTGRGNLRVPKELLTPFLRVRL